MALTNEQFDNAVAVSTRHIRKQIGDQAKANSEKTTQKNMEDDEEINQLDMGFNGNLIFIAFDKKVDLITFDLDQAISFSKGLIRKISKLAVINKAAEKVYKQTLERSKKNGK